MKINKSSLQLRKLEKEQKLNKAKKGSTKDEG